MPAMMLDANNTISDGTRRAINTPVSSGTNSVHSDILNVLDRPSVYSATCNSALVALPSPVIKKMVMAIRNVGTVVSVM